MSFWIYKIAGTQCDRQQQVKLTGESGLIAQYLTSMTETETPFAWEIDENELLVRACGGDVDDSLCMVMEMEGGENPVLYRITGIRGFSEIDDTDLVLCFKILKGEEDDGRQLLEPLRLTGGTKEGKYLWARPKMDIGAAICPAA